ncbi:hypothetical protein [Desulfofundulus sp.]
MRFYTLYELRHTMPGDTVRACAVVPPDRPPDVRRDITAEGQ